MNYDSYKAICKEKWIVNPYKTEYDFNRAYGIVTHKEKLEVKPKHMQSLDMSNAKTLKIKHSTSSVRLSRKPSADNRKRKTNREMVAPKISYNGMSTEEIKAYKAKLAREWRARVKPHRTPYSELTDKQKEVYIIAKKKHYAANRDTILAKNKLKRANITPEEKATINSKMREWRASLSQEAKDAINKRMQDARKIKRNKAKEEARK